MHDGCTRYCAHRCAQPQLANNTSGCRTSAIRGMMYESCTTKSPVLSFQLHRLLRVLKLYYKVASSQLPAHGLLRVLKLYYKVATATPRTTVVLQSRQFSASSSTATPRTKVVLETCQFSASSSTATPRTKDVLQSTHGARSTVIYNGTASPAPTPDQSRPALTKQPPQTL